MLSDNVLPEGLMEEIIVRLPAKSLLRFKRVAKSWYTLITDRSFIAKHLERSKSISKSRRLKLLCSVEGVNRVPCVSLISNSKPQPSYCCLHPMEPLPRRRYRHQRFYGHCDGIFCQHVVSVLDRENTRTRGDLILWNPTTKEVKFIPKSPCLLPKGIDFFMFGFGFDPISKNYKLVQVSDSPLLELGVRLAEVYDLSTNSWRVLDAVVPDFGNYFYDCKSYLNGIYHWYVCDQHEMTKDFILSFDFSKEVFEIIKLPFEHASNSFLRHGVFVIDESLAVAEYDRNTKRSRIWVMNEYGVESSWTNRFEIGPLSVSPSIIGSWRDNEILIEESCGRLISYNLQNQHIHRFQPDFRPNIYAFDYVESLVPLEERGQHSKIVSKKRKRFIW